MSVEGSEDIEGLKRVSAAVVEALRTMFDRLKPGMTTLELDAIGAAVLKRHGAKPAPKLCYGFPYATMISINEEVAHGMPSDRIIRDGDLVNIDISAELGGYFSDTGYTMPVGAGNRKAERLCRASKQALAEALKVARHGRRIRDVEKAVRKVAQKYGFSVIENLVGHGVGRHLHEEPQNIPCWGDRRDERRFVEGTVLTIEPFLSTGPKRVFDKGDGWTVMTKPGNLTAQFEHTIIITRGEPIVLTAA
ncbi:type I methionyl aminopeptidase [Pelagicoccus mobilis]|uniref:Methionine aminopeptidase n=1 Tax=Pelagicoccus mobilis TaxID=415221 RepID=A0A934VN95_9BACT|nr:type I methionyl aminopeptidase [Pelagicoccus mobilis]MBK1879696.1 type I methionyl aminopeptidase [Pelagicoccus mobilis]